MAPGRPCGLPADWLVPDWHAEGVGALMTTRNGGCSPAPFDSMNLRAEVGDDPGCVARNVARLAEVVGGMPVRLDQVHGAAVVRLGLADAAPGAAVRSADAAVTTELGFALTVQVADCLPVLFAAPDGRAVGAAHAGWRGLAAGVLEATLTAVCSAAACRPAEVHVWLGACIGPEAFEVGADVLAAFGAPPGAGARPGFVPRGRGAPNDPRVATEGEPKWLADLPSIARQRLGRAGVESIRGGAWCTVSDPSRFFSFRRDRVTGRMAAAVWIDRAGGR